MAVLDLRRQGRAAQMTLSSDTALTAEERGRAIATWKARMVNEHISARVFAGIIPQMMKAGLDADWQEAVAIMISDELRHGRQCAAVVHALGAEAIAEMPSLPDVPDHEDAEPLEAFLRNLLSISCLSETVAVALIRAEHNEVGPPELTGCLTEILADEVQHARFGWDVLRDLGDRLTPELAQRLGDYLVCAFRHLREHELAHLPIDPGTTDEAARYGVCDGGEARTLFFRTVEDVIVPGLEKHGIPGRAAWQASLDPV